MLFCTSDPTPFGLTTLTERLAALPLASNFTERLPCAALLIQDMRCEYPSSDHPHHAVVTSDKLESLEPRRLVSEDLIRMMLWQVWLMPAMRAPDHVLGHSPSTHLPSLVSPVSGTSSATCPTT